MKTTFKMLALTMILGLATADVAMAQQFGGGQFGRQRFSRQREPLNATYSVTNAGSVDVELYWNDFRDGRETLYSTIRPGETFNQPTFVGHSWTIRTAGTREVLSRETLNAVAMGRTVRPQGTFNPQPPQPNPQPTPPKPLPPTPGPLPPTPSPLPPSPTPPMPGDNEGSLPPEARERSRAITYLNQIRANPGAFRHLSASLGDADVQARPALKLNEALQVAAQRKAEFMASSGQFEHVMTINGQQVGMNQWMREAGYSLASYLPNNQSNFECLYADAGFRIEGLGQRAIDSFMREGKDGGHVLPTLGRGFWTHCKDIGVGVAIGRDGMTYVCVLVGAFDPQQP